MRISRVVATATLAGILLFPAMLKAQALDPNTHVLLSQLLTGLVLSERDIQYDYAQAMRRLDRQEAEAQAKAYRKSHGNPERYDERLDKIERKYAHKRDKVERNTARRYGYR